jgi:hypothetical protein
MAARRVLILIVAVLVVSTIGTAVLAPRPDPAPEGATTSTTASTPKQKDGRSGRLVEKAVQVASRRPRTVRLRAGDQLELTVRTRTPVQVEIPRLGMIEDAAPDAPAHFSVLPASPGRFEVRLAQGRTVAVIRVGP